MVTYSVPHLDRSQPQSSPPLTSARPAGVARLGGVRMHLTPISPPSNFFWPKLLHSASQRFSVSKERMERSEARSKLRPRSGDDSTPTKLSHYGSFIGNTSPDTSCTVVQL